MSSDPEQHGGARCCGRWRLWAALLAAPLVVTLAAGAAWMWWYNIGPSSWRFFLPGLTSWGFIKYALLTLGSATALVALCAYLWHAGAAERRRRAEAREFGGREGGAMVEFVMVLPIALMLALILAQASLLMVGNLCVHYSAYCAARAAIVAIPDDMSPDEPPNYVDRDPDSSAKYRRILMAAAWAVMPVSCSIRAQSGSGGMELVEGLERFFDLYGRRGDEDPRGNWLPIEDKSDPDYDPGFYREDTSGAPGWVRFHLGRKWRYALDHTFVDVSPPKNGDVYAEAEDIHVTVRHTFYLAVPYANVLFSRADPDGRELDIGSGEYGTVITATCTLTNEGVQDFVDEEEFPR